MAEIVRVGDPIWINRALSTRDARVATAGLLSTAWGDDALAPRPGVLPESRLTALRVSPTDPASMSVVVNAGHCVVVQPGQGPWLVPVESAVQLDISPPDPTNPRIDLVVVRVYDLDQGETSPVEPDQGGRGVATVEVISGDPSATPSAPEVPIRSFVIGRIETTPSTTTIGLGQLTDTRTWTVSRGGVRPLLGVTDLSPSYTGEVVSIADGTLGVGVDDPNAPYRGVQAKPRLFTQNLRTGPFRETQQLASLVIADPGFPYQIDVEASVAFTLGANMRVDLLSQLDAINGPFLTVPSVGQFLSASAHVTRFIGANMGRTYTGSHTVLLMAAVVVSPNNNQYGVEVQNSGFSLRVVPAVG